MKVEQWDIDRVKPYPGNPRRNDAAIEPVARSIEQFGFRQPLVVEPDGTIVVGHTRWLAARKLGLKKVPVHVAIHSAPIAKYGLPTDWSFWERLDRRFLEMCDEVVVLTLPGWQESAGVQAEIRIAGELGKPVRCLDQASIATSYYGTSPKETV